MQEPKPDNKMSVHDRFTRSSMSRLKVAEEFFQHNLPEHIKTLIDLSSLKVEKESFIDDKLKLQIADLLFSANFNDNPGFLYVLFEHTSSSRAILPFRMLKYMVAIMDHHLESTKDKKNVKLPLIYPIVLYNGKKPYRHSMDLFDLFSPAEKEIAKQTLMSPYHLIDLTQIPDDTLRNFLYYGTLGRVLKHIHDFNILPFVEDIFYALKELEKRGEEKYIYNIVAYISAKGEIPNQATFADTIKKLESIEERKLMTLGECLTPFVIQKATEKGREEGREQGRLDTAKALLAQGVDIEIIAKATTLSKEEIQKLLS